ELKLIGDKNYSYFFLTVHRIFQHASYDIKVLCLGSGSEAYSVICYCLEIKEVDTQNSTLIFDRFIYMHPDEPPDIYEY
ncbi:hypothetical protein HER19_33435, partial [Rhizobium sp. BGM003]|nr:hypothetical protein [Rhizobium phaseoli]